MYGGRPVSIFDDDDDEMQLVFALIGADLADLVWD